MCAEKMARHESTRFAKNAATCQMLMKLRQLKGCTEARLSNFLSPDSFDDVLSAVRLECRFVPSDEHQLARLSTPSLALQKCAAMLRNAALKARDGDLASSAANYLLIHAS